MNYLYELMPGEPEPLTRHGMVDTWIAEMAGHPFPSVGLFERQLETLSWGLERLFGSPLTEEEFNAARKRAGA